MRSIHEARRLRQAGDVDGALAVLAGVDATKVETREARWGLLRVDAAGEAAVRRPRRPGLQPGHGTGRRAGAHRRRRDAGGRGGLGDALEAGQGGLGAQPPGPAASGRGCVMVTANVDITALKARHPLGDTVEAAGVRLRGRGRVRQGVCPFHDEAEGSFTVYADSERFYCFGCGRGRRRAGLHPAGRGAVAARCHRAAGRQPRACAQGRHSSSPNAASERPPRCLHATPPC